ncbi:hypothetical protein BDV25DRAFT_152764 [Aspergillus avenaceus]|uniref:Uncharacterized protein n=1 Tax=Aspergillus avenaceus TaxID=36643 RepID=A0A5N6TYF1_ASPAV|nr:hypothetical protein BDV25DRAFT_152764 [Aspergillus avenaceus]
MGSHGIPSEASKPCRNSLGFRYYMGHTATQAGVKDPRHAPILGLIRTMRLELAASSATCEMDETYSTASINVLVDVVCDFQDRSYDGVLSPE